MIDQGAHFHCIEFACVTLYEKIKKSKLNVQFSLSSFPSYSVSMVYVNESATKF